MWICEDIELIAQGVRNGSWIDGSLGVVSAGLDALALVSDPVGALLQYGIAWLIEHVRPLSEALDWLAGDPAQITAHAQTWRNVAGSLREEAAELARAVRNDVAGWAAAPPAYRAWAAEQQQAITGLAQGVDTLAAITEGAAGWWPPSGSWSATPSPPACPASSCTRAVSSSPADWPHRWSWNRSQPWWRPGSADRAAAARVAGEPATADPEVRRLGDLIEKLKQVLGRLRDTSRGRSGSAADGARGVHGGHTTRPRNLADYGGRTVGQRRHTRRSASRPTPTS
ncbi:hypothetical protein NKG94_06240 [Micromonospora sp. M12]